MVDVVFADLNLVVPTHEEMVCVMENVAKMELLWDACKLSWTPKVHLLFRHCCDDMEKYGGLVDKVKQGIEQ